MSFLSRFFSFCVDLLNNHQQFQKVDFRLFFSENGSKW